MNWNDQVLARKEALLQDLKGLLQIASVKDLSTSGPGKPMGSKIAEALSYMLRLAENEQFRTHNIDGFVGYAEYEAGRSESDDYIGVLCHLDVVPATGEWTSPPFQPEIRDGKLYARGAIDDKGPTLAAFYGLKIVKELGLPLKHKVRIIFGTDEENGNLCIETYRRMEPMPIGGFAPDSEFPITHAEKGQINTRVVLVKGNELEGDQDNLKLVSFVAGDVANMVPVLAIAVITGDALEIAIIEDKFDAYCKSSGGKGWITVSTQGNILSEQGHTSVTLHIEGKSAHGMEPEKGINAGFLLAHFLQGYSFQGDASNFLDYIDACLYNDYSGIGLGIQSEDDILGPLTVNVGIMRFTEDEESFVHLNIRYPIVTDYEQAIETISDKSSKYQFIMEQPIIKIPHHVSKEHPLIKTLQRVYEEETSLEPTLLTTGGGTYASFLNNGVAFGALFPGREATAHRPDEYIDVDDLLKATAIYARAIYELANLDYS